MSCWSAKCKNEYGEYEITFASRSREKAKAVEKVCRAVIDGTVKTPEDIAVVIRCKDCRESKVCTNFYGKKYLGCTLDPDVIYEVDVDHFCAYGKGGCDDGSK